MQGRLLTENEIMDMAEQLLPVMDKMAEMPVEIGKDRYIAMYRWNDGAVSADGSGLAGWRIERDRDGSVRLNFNYSRKLEVKKDE